MESKDRIQKNPLVKPKFKLFGLLCLHELCVVLMSATAMIISLLFSKKVGQDGAGFLPIDIYQVFYPIFFSGMLLFVTGYHFIWKKWLSQEFRNILKENRFWLIGVISLSAVVLLVMFWVNLFVFIAMIGLFSTLKNSLDYVVLFPCCFAVLYPLVLTLFSRICKQKK